MVLQSSEDDTSQFDSKFTKQTPVDSPDESTLSESANMIFKVSRFCFLCFSLLLSVYCFQGFTYVAPSVLEDMYKSHIVKARSPRKFGSTPRIHFNQGLGNSVNQLGAHCSNLGHFSYNNFSDEMMEVSTGLPPV